jgi:hypothetical protein
MWLSLHKLERFSGNRFDISAASVCITISKVNTANFVCRYVTLAMHINLEEEV